MASDYYIDLQQVSLQRFRQMLEAKELLPSRQILREGLDERFRTLEGMGIGDVQALADALKTKRHVAQLAEESGLPEEYLTILRREVNSYVPRPINLDKLPDLAPEHVERLAAVGIKHTRHLYERARTKAERATLAQETWIAAEALLEMVQLADLARIVGVGRVFARFLYDAGIHTVADFVTESPEALLERLQAAELEKYTRVTLRVEDLEYCLEMARLLPQGIKYK